jgi:hypothetical protein
MIAAYVAIVGPGMSCDNVTAICRLLKGVGIVTILPAETLLPFDVRGLGCSHIAGKRTEAQNK